MYTLPIERKTLLPALLLLLFGLASTLEGIAAKGRVIYLRDGKMIFCDAYWLRRDGVYHVRVDRHTSIDLAEEKVFDVGKVYRGAPPGYQLAYKYDSLSKTYISIPYYVHEHGFFFQWQINVVAINGMRVMMGYRINRYIAICLGTGGEYGLTVSTPFNDHPANDPNIAPPYVYNSGYSPFLLYLTGDILKTKVTPFYSFEVGYNLPWYPHLMTNPDDGANRGPYSYYTNYGGLTSGVGIGCRFYSHKRSNISLSLNVNAGYVSIKTDGFQGFSSSTLTYITTTSRYTMVQPSLRFSVGF